MCSPKIEYLAESIAKRIILNWEFQLPTSFQDKMKAEELLKAVKGLKDATTKTKKG